MSRLRHNRRETGIRGQLASFALASSTGHRDQDQGHVDLLALVGDDGYPKETRVHGRLETLENFGHCFTNAVKRDDFGVSTGRTRWASIA